MPPLGHRAPGLAGAVLASPEVQAEVICDGVHVHPAMVRLAVRAKGVDGVMAISDGTAAAGLPPGTRARLGGRPIVAGERTATLEDGTIAGSLLTMDGAFRLLVGQVGLSLVEAARLCATTPARALGLGDAGRLAPGLRADLVLLDRDLRVRQTWLAGRPCGT
jgi:N-acetylglucosamine-6-phosphate deacetylase